MGRYYFILIVVALILMAFAAIGLVMNAKKHPSLGTAASASHSRSWWLTARHPRLASKKPFRRAGRSSP
jgi:hypothetical protein